MPVASLSRQRKLPRVTIESARSSGRRKRSARSFSLSASVFHNSSPIAPVLQGLASQSSTPALPDKRSRLRGSPRSSSVLSRDAEFIVLAFISGRLVLVDHRLPVQCHRAHPNGRASSRAYDPSWRSDDGRNAVRAHGMSTGSRCFCSSFSVA